MNAFQLFLTLVPPVSAILFTVTTSRIFDWLLLKKCAHAAARQKLPMECANVLAPVVRGAVAVVSLFPSFISFLVALVTGFYAFGWLVIALFFISILFFIKPIVLIAGNDFYEMNNDAMRLFRDEPGRRTSIQVINKYMIFLNFMLIIASVIVFIASDSQRAASATALWLMFWAELRRLIM